MLLSAMQDGLAALYETPVAHCVTDFLITDARLAHALEAAERPRANPERLLLRQSADALDISLFIDSAVLAALQDSDPYACLDASNLNDFLVALEGVSHFHYLVWNALYQRPVTQLELELQAEVDKFVTATMVLDGQGTRVRAADVHAALFSAVHFDADLDEVSGRRYREANHYAAKYCQHLTRRFPGQHREPSFVNELRRFYRLPQNGKIRCIEQP